MRAATADEEPTYTALAGRARQELARCPGCRKAVREEEGLRHVFIEVGPHTVLHLFQVPGVEPPGYQAMFERGRLDHFGLNAASEEAFLELRRRVIFEDPGDGEVTDMGSLLSFSFTDPDGGADEVIWVKPNVAIEETLPRAEWTPFDLG